MRRTFEQEVCYTTSTEICLTDTQEGPDGTELTFSWTTSDVEYVYPSVGGIVKVWRGINGYQWSFSGQAVDSEVLEVLLRMTTDYYAGRRD